MGRTTLLGVSVALALATACLAVMVLMESADATFPGRNGYIAFVGDASEASEGIYRMRLDGSGLRKLPEGYVLGGPDYSADGRKLTFHEDVCDNGTGPCDLIFVMNSDGSGKRAITTEGNDLFPAFYPSGGRIVYSSDGDDFDDLDLYSIPVSGGTPTQLTSYSGSHYDRFPEVSPDGSKIVFSSNRDGDYEIYALRTGHPEGPDNPLIQLTDNDGYDSSPDFSPDGGRIVYESYRSGNHEVIVMNAAGSGKKNLTHNPATDYHPAFSPDGNMIAFVRGSSVWKMRADGTRQTRLTRGIEVGYPDWQPLP